MQTYHLKKFRKRYGYMFLDGLVILNDHKDKRTMKKHTVQSAILNYLFDNVGFFTATSWYRRKKRISNLLEYKKQIAL